MLAEITTCGMSKLDLVSRTVGFSVVNYKDFGCPDHLPYLAARLKSSAQEA